MRRFRASCHVRCLQTEESPKKFHDFVKRPTRWWASYMANLRETSSNFYHSLHIWYHDILTSFMIFGFRLPFIEFKNNWPQVRGHVLWTRCSKLVVCSWIRPYIILNNMNIIFPFIFFIIRMTSSYNLNYPRKFN